MSATSSTAPLRVTAASGSYDVHVGVAGLAPLAVAARAHSRSGRCVVVTDTNVARAWRSSVEAKLAESGLQQTWFELAPGEATKTIASADSLYTSLIEGGFSRADVLVAVGGGVVGDLSGFVAATYHRGMPWVHAATSLLAQVDSSIGGKVAVDHRLGKNLIGAFHPPRAVVSDVRMLQTLPLRERWNGLAEVVKSALIADVPLLELLETNLEALGNATAAEGLLLDVIRRSAAIKVRVVSEDEREEGVRLHLNFGHTLGHALELATGFGPLLHGEAIVIGMRVAVELSRELGTLNPEEAARALALLGRFPAPPVSSPAPSVEALRAALGRDKKSVGGKVRFVVLEGLGKAGVVGALPPELLERGLRMLVEPV